MADPQFPYPFYPVQFTKDAVIFQQSDVDGLIAGLTQDPRPTDLFVMSGGCRVE